MKLVELQNHTIEFFKVKNLIYYRLYKRINGCLVFQSDNYLSNKESLDKLLQAV